MVPPSPFLSVGITAVVSALASFRKRKVETDRNSNGEFYAANHFGYCYGHYEQHVSI